MCVINNFTVENEFLGIYANDDANIVTSEAECIQLQSLAEVMMKNLKNRKINSNKWRYFEKREGFIVAKFPNIFHILSDITKDKNQKSLDDFKKSKRKETRREPSKINPSYEEDKSIDSESSKNNEVSNFRLGEKSDDIMMDEIEMKIKRRGRKLDEVNEENIEDWINIMYNAVKDLTSLMKKERNSRLNLEDLYQAFNTIMRINDKVKGI